MDYIARLTRPVAVVAASVVALVVVVMAAALNIRLSMTEMMVRVLVVVIVALGVVLKMLSSLKSKVDRLTKELTVKRSVIEKAKIESDNLKKQLQQLQNDKRAPEQQMNKLVEDFMTMKQRRKIDPLSEKNIKSESSKIKMLENDKETLIQTNKKLSKEVGRLMSVDNDCDHYKEQLQKRDTELNVLKLSLDKKEQELQTTEITLTTFREDFEAERKDRENAHNIKEEEIRKARAEMKKSKAEFDKRFCDTKQSLEAQVAKQRKQLEKQQTQLEKIEKSKQEVMQKYQETLETNKVLQAKLEKPLDPLENIEELKEVEDLGEEIGRGAYGVVKKVSLHGTVCAAKDIHAILINYASGKELERIKKSFLEECVKSSKLFHPNIVQFLGIHYPSKQAKLPWLVMELLDCNLAGFVEKYDNKSVTLLVKASIFCDISLGLQFLHSRDIIHRDLSSNNVLLTKHLTAKISDLGVAKLVDPSGTKSHTEAPGTRHFLPPEVISDVAKSHYGKPIDVFSLGCIMIHVTTHEWPAPLPETHYDPKLKKKVVLSEIERREAYLKQIQKLPELKVLVESCLYDDPGLRPNATKMVDEVGKLKSLYQKKSSFASNEMNAVEFEKRLKFQDKRISEQQLEIQKLNKTIQEAQGFYMICHKCNQ